MARKTLIDYYNGVKEELIYDHVDQKFFIKQETDVQKTIDLNKALQNSGHNFDTHQVLGKHVARVEPVTLNEWGKHRGLPFDWFYSNEYSKELDAFLNDPDNKYWRTGGGTL